MASYQQNFTLIDNMSKFIGIIDKLRDVGLDKVIKLPRIVVLGTQSSGKSSLLESIVGIDFLPRGSGVVTRRPLEMRLIHVSEAEAPKPYAIFDEIKDKKFTDFDEVRQQINALTDKVAGGNKGIVDIPIILTIYSNTCPDLTLVDLPGITRIPIRGSDQNEDIEKVTKDMSRKYCQESRTIILCVIPANQDLSVSDSLQMARELDPTGDRTLGVLTKIDIMDKGTDGRRLILGQDIPLKLGYVGVKLRSQADINENKKVKEALLEEKLFFSKHPVYSSMPAGHLGIETLTSKLSKILFKHIHNYLPEIMMEIQKKLDEAQNRLNQLGQPLPQTDNEKFHLLYDLVTKFSDSFKSAISGKYEMNNNKSINKNYMENLSDGARIRQKFTELFQDIIKDDNKNFGSRRYTDQDIFKAITYYEGDKLTGFLSIDAFNYLLQPLVEELKEPSQDCVNDVYLILEKLSQGILTVQCERFPFIQGDMHEMINNFLEVQRENTKNIVEDYLNAEIGYVHTNDDLFQNSYLEYLREKQKSESGKKEVDKQIENIDPSRARQILINEFRYKIDTYYKIMIRGIKDTVPKIIGNFFVKGVQRKVQMYLLEELQKNDELKKSFEEPAHITEERDRLYKLVTILKNAQKIIKRDPELSEYLHKTYENRINKQKQEERDSFKQEESSINRPSQTMISNQQNISYQQSQDAQRKQQGNQYFPSLQHQNSIKTTDQSNSLFGDSQKVGQNSSQDILGQQKLVQKPANTNNSLFGDYMPPQNQQRNSGTGGSGQSLIKEKQIQQQNSQNIQQKSNQQQTFGQQVEQKFDAGVDKAVGNVMSNKNFQQQVGNQVTQQVNRQMGLDSNNAVGQLAGQMTQKTMDNKQVQQGVANQAKNQAKETVKDTKTSNKGLFGLF